MLEVTAEGAPRHVPALLLGKGVHVGVGDLLWQDLEGFSSR